MFDWVLNISLVSVKNKQTNYLTWKNENFTAFFWDGVQLFQGYRATMRRQFTFYHLLPRSNLEGWKDAGLRFWTQDNWLEIPPP